MQRIQQLATVDYLQWFCCCFTAKCNKQKVLKTMALRRRQGKTAEQKLKPADLNNLAQLSVLATCKPCAVKLLTVNFSTAQREACYNKLNND